MIDIEVYMGYPCHTKNIVVDGIKIPEEYFGSGSDVREDIDLSDIDEDTLTWGCVNYVWERDESVYDDAFNKYGITYSTWSEVCDRLEDVLSIGKCGWCV